MASAAHARAWQLLGHLTAASSAAPNNGTTSAAALAAPVAVTVKRVDLNDIVDLRTRVLRAPGSPPMRLAGYDDEQAIHVGAFTSDGTLVSCVSIRPAPAPASVPAEWRAQGHVAWQCRAVAVDASVRNSGIGAQAMLAAEQHARENGCTLFWANARIRAVPLYKRIGFSTFGDIWEEKNIGPHIVIAKQLRMQADSPANSAAAARSSTFSTAATAAAAQ